MEWQASYDAYKAIKSIAPSDSTIHLKSSLGVVQQLINLGAYEEASAHILEIDRSPRSRADPYVRHEISRLNGWLHYYLGRLETAERHFMDCLQDQGAQASHHLEAGALHFLARVRLDQAMVVRHRQLKMELIDGAESTLRRAIRLRRKYGNDGDRAFDLIRLAQIKTYRARSLRQRDYSVRPHLVDARTFMGSSFGTLHVDLLEAGLSFEEHQYQSAEKQVTSVLEKWSELGYPKGIADALILVGQLKESEQDYVGAIEAYVSAVCIYPHLSNPMHMNTIKHANILLRTMGIQTNVRPQTQLAMLKDDAMQRRSYFGLLDHVTPDRRKSGLEVFDQFASGGA